VPTAALTKQASGRALSYLFGTARPLTCVLWKRPQHKPTLCGPNTDRTLLILDDLSPYSRRFAARLFEQFPQWREHARAETEARGTLRVLLVEVPSPADPNERMWISTDDGEISVGFGSRGWHAHYGEFIEMTEEAATEAALEEIHDIVGERAVVASRFRDGGFVDSTLLLSDSPVDTRGADFVEVISWKGTHNTVVRAA